MSIPQRHSSDCCPLKCTAQDQGDAGNNGRKECVLLQAVRSEVGKQEAHFETRILAPVTQQVNHLLCTYGSLLTSFGHINERLQAAEWTIRVLKEQRSDHVAAQAMEKVRIRVGLCLREVLHSKHNLLVKHRQVSVLPSDIKQLGATQTSPSCECMLDDFRNLLTALETKFGSKLFFFPDRIQALHTVPDKGCKIGVIFPSYSALCDAFEVDTNERVEGAMRTKETKNDGIIALQITGLLHKSNHSHACIPMRRARLFVGQGTARPGQNAHSSRNVLIDNNYESVYGTYLYLPHSAEERPRTENRDSLQAEYAITWTLSNLCKATLMTPPAAIPGKIRIRLVTSIIRCKTRANAIADELTKQRASYGAENLDGSLLYDLCTRTS